MFGEGKERRREDVREMERKERERERERERKENKFKDDTRSLDGLKTERRSMQK